MRQLYEATRVTTGYKAVIASSTQPLLLSFCILFPLSISIGSSTEDHATAQKSYQAAFSVSNMQVSSSKLTICGAAVMD